MSSPRLAWAITGSGHYIEECVEFLLTLSQVDLYLSAAAEEVLKMYHIDLNRLKAKMPIYRDKSASSPPVGLFYKGYYHSLIIAPTTSNTVAKFTLGIADNLVTNLYAQAGKCRIPSIIYPCDIDEAMETTAPGGKVMVYPRPIDLAATAQLRQMSYTQVVNNVSELIIAVEQQLSSLS
ncbi:MAG: hypothetical protein RL637_923 [Pseudomonadota bacterium]|jgi:flavoprotein